MPLWAYTCGDLINIGAATIAVSAMPASADMTCRFAFIVILLIRPNFIVYTSDVDECPLTRRTHALVYGVRELSRSGESKGQRLSF
jgi:hypothetical protein